MKKYDCVRELIDYATECTDQAISNMNKRRAGCACCVFADVSDKTNEHSKESDETILEILTIISNKLKKRGYYTITYQRNKDGGFLLYITKEWFYIESVKTLHNIRPNISEVAFCGLMGKVLGLSDDKIKEEIGYTEEDNNEEE